MRRIFRCSIPITLLVYRVRESRRTFPLRHWSRFTGLRNSLRSSLPWNTAALLAYQFGSTVVGCLQVLVNSEHPIREFLPFGSTLIYDGGRLSTSVSTGTDIRHATVCTLGMWQRSSGSKCNRLIDKSSASKTSAAVLRRLCHSLSLARGARRASGSIRSGETPCRAL